MVGLGVFEAGAWGGIPNGPPLGDGHLSCQGTECCILEVVEHSHVIVLAFQDCTPDLWPGPVAVCRWRGRVLVGDVEAGGTEGGVAFGCGGLFPLFRLVRVCRVALLRWSSWKERDSFVADVGVGVVCQGLASLDGGDPDALVLLVPASPPT